VTTRVIVVDDDDISRRGLAALLDDSSDITVVGAFTHGDAVNLVDAWNRVDVVVVDAADERMEEDQFPGVRVVEQIRRHRTSEQTLILVLTGHYFHAALRRRMREARADFLYHRSELQDTDDLLRAVLHPDQARTLPREDDLEELMRHGVSAHTRVNEAIAYAQSDAMADSFTEPGAPRSRRWLAQRREFNRVARLAPVNRDGLPPDREQREPSVVQIERFLRWATRIRRDDG
jgi:DNA-binding NarL/FixJ family response regulator